MVGQEKQGVRKHRTVTKANKEREQPHRNAWGQETSSPMDKRVLQSPLYFLLERLTAGVCQRQPMLAKSVTGGTRLHWIKKHLGQCIRG